MVPTLRKVAISDILMHESRGLCIIPKLPPSRDYQFIHRAARSVRWNDEARMLYSVPVKDWTYRDTFKSIIAAVAEEYGDRLCIDDDTVWTDIPASVQSEIGVFGDSEV